MLEINFKESFLLMFLMVVIIKVFTFVYEQLLLTYASNKDRANEIIKKSKPLYYIFSLSCGVLIGIASYYESQIITKEISIYLVYYTGGILLIYHYLFKHLISTIEKIIKRKGQKI